MTFDSHWRRQAGQILQLNFSEFYPPACHCAGGGYLMARIAADGGNRVIITPGPSIKQLDVQLGTGNKSAADF